MDKFQKFIGGVTLIALFFIYNIFSWGFVFYKFYNWFILPVFTNLPQITFISAVGISIFTSMLNRNNQIKIDKTEEIEYTKAFLSIALPFLVLGLGWLTYVIFI